MKKSFYLLFLGGALIVLAGGCVQYEVIGQNGEENPLDAQPTVISDAESPSATTTEPETVGGARDSHGCLVGAGYQYCPSKEKCLRIWEEKCDEIDENGLKQTFATEDENLAASGTIAYIKASDHYGQNSGSQIYVTELNKRDCSGCYDVTVNYKVNIDNQILRITATVSMDDWNVTDINLAEVPIQERTANECVDAGGRVVDTMEDGACKYQEAYVGNISDRDQPNICCK